MKNRKLFPVLTDPNQTTDCPVFCDPACPYNCYDYYYLSPPPPPPPPPPLPLSNQNHYISPYVIIFVSLLASFFLLVGYYVIIVNSCFGCRCCSRNNNNRQLPHAQTDVSDEEEFVDENRVDHPIWFIATVGLQQSVINSITVCKYKKGEGLIEGTECSVCLNEFQEDETVRLLPKCNHAFHISCIDAWLRDHTNCPLCRAHIVFDAPSAAGQNSNNADVVFDTQIENSEVGAEQSENRAISADTTLCSDENGDLVVFGERIDQIKRCASMDSSSAASLFLGLPNLCPIKSEGSSFDQKEDVENPHSSTIPNSGEFRIMGSSSIADQHLRLSPVPMKRSFSCSGRFFSSKRFRSTNSVLPL